jgi:hypothetical protein
MFFEENIGTDPPYPFENFSAVVRFACMCVIGYNVFDIFFDKMKHPRLEIDAKWNSKTHL